MNNTVGIIIVIIGVVEIIAGFIAGIMFGSVGDGYGGVTFHFQLALIWWIAGVVSGMLLIGFAEVIKLLDNINNKLKGKTDLSTGNDTNAPIQNQPKSNNGIKKTEYQKEIPLSRKKIITKYLKDNQVSFNEVFDSPFENFVVIGSNGRYQLVKVIGKNPKVLTKEELTEEMKEWFEQEYSDE